MATTSSIEKRERMQSSPSTEITAHPRARPSYSTGDGSEGQPSSGIMLLALLSSGLLWLSYFPVSWGWLAWVGLVPWLGLVRSSARPAKLYFVSWLTGLAFFVPALQWMRVADPRMVYTWLGLALYCSFYFPVALFLLRFAERKTSVPLWVSLPVVWTALEYFRSTFATGFSWYLLGHTQHDFAHLIQFSDITGAWGVSFLVLLGNAVLFEWLWRWHSRDSETARPSLRTLVLCTCGFVVLVAGALGYGAWRLGQTTMTSGPRVALIQGNVPQQLRNAMSDKENPDSAKAGNRVLRHYDTLANVAATFRPDLIVWPETSFPNDWYDLAPGEDPARAPRRWFDEHQRSLANAQYYRQRWGTATLLGLNSWLYENKKKKGQRYNTALFIDENGRIGGMYHKIHRVPFGEYVPLKETFPWMNDLAPYDYDYSIGIGQEYTRFPLKTRSGERFDFGTIICYEDTDPLVTRPFGGSDGKRPADFLVNISNDGWFDGTCEHEEHLAICRFRAVENRRSVARSVNMGISAVIDSNGKVLRPTRSLHPLEAGLLGFSPLGGSLSAVPWLQLKTVCECAPVDGPVAYPPVWVIGSDAEGLPISEWGEYKKKDGVFLATIPIDTRSSLYTRLGDWLPWLCWFVLFGMVGFRLVGRFSSRKAEPATE